MSVCFLSGAIQATIDLRGKSLSPKTAPLHLLGLSYLFFY